METNLFNFGFITGFQRMSLQSKCLNCKYLGDLDEICPKYMIGIAEDGSPIIRKNFPLFCKECDDRDLDFCTRFRDLICYNEQDPFKCSVNLDRDNLSGVEFLRKRRLEKFVLNVSNRLFSRILFQMGLQMPAWH